VEFVVCQSLTWLVQNLVTVQGNGVVKIIVITKHLGSDTKWPKMLVNYDFQHGIIAGWKYN
jgi:hypothetical protein